MSTATVIQKRKIPDHSDTQYSKRRQNSLISTSSNPISESGISKCFRKVTTSLYVSLAPSYIGNPIEGIKAQHLDRLVMTYFQPAKGVVLAYSNIKLNAENYSKDSEDNKISVAKIAYESPFAFMWITVDFLVWKPEIGDVVEGWIYMQSQSHIGLLIHDTFNATIKKNNIPSNWYFVPNQADEYLEEDEKDGSNDISTEGDNGGASNGGISVGIGAGTGTGAGSGSGSNDASISQVANGTSKFRSMGHWVDENNVPVEGKLRFTIKSLHTAGRVVSVEGTLIKAGSERDSLPVTASPQQHKRFDDNNVTNLANSVIDIGEPKDDELTEVPIYEKESEDDEDEENQSEEKNNEIIAEADSSSNEEESDS
ncbi:hypothetical protein PACTADRAFT_50061 [Pachysolen tannophilus NRRL Y-2460]|uniref:DNA-directed RNA polymerase subunit n=1 Tax=Pachysolen tannophilus NRRL Y-2460 TaxID=669874 RepID=A0A1E4TUA2_PACTA|nr:hypothetical protein PACTADRAFT_50061 [Pachysolen tannophilus NRRL Y-2460]